jgi:hypothetical protein
LTSPRESTWRPTSGTQTRSDQQATLSETGDDPYIRYIMEQLKKHQQNNIQGPSGKTSRTIHQDHRGNIAVPLSKVLHGNNDILSWQEPQLCLKIVPLIDYEHLDIVDFVSLPILIIKKTFYNPGMAMNVNSFNII